MKIKCIYNKWPDVPKDIFPINDFSNKESDFYIEIDAEYTVYGMTVRNGCIWYYTRDKAFTYFPRWKPSYFFEVVDPRLSRYWIYSCKKFKNYSQAHPIITFPQWADNHPDFYDMLSDGEEKEVMIFKTYKELMDLEFPDSSISEIAQIGDDEWLICPTCLDAWQYNDDKDALVRCPKCLKVLNNPRYKNEYPHL